jgi:hypothetical protein
MRALNLNIKKQSPAAVSGDGAQVVVSLKGQYGVISIRFIGGSQA